MLLVPHGGLPSRLDSNITSTSSEGVLLTASATPHAKGAWTQVIASTTFDAYGVWVMVSGTATASTATAALVDIGIGGAGAETVLIPDLDAGNATAWGGTMGHAYFFPISVPSGSRISARMQALIASDTASVGVFLLGGTSVPGMWVGSRVTAYGVDAANSRGTAITAGSTNVWGSTVQISSSTANPIRYLQIGMNAGADGTGNSIRYLLRLGLGASPVWFVDELPIGESTTVESLHFMGANWMLSQMHHRLPAGSDLRAAAMTSGTGEARYLIVYGVE